MGHGDNVEELHRTLWEAVEAETFFVPSKQKYGRLSMYGTKERLESLEQQFATLRSQMGADAKTAAKMEKKAGVLLAGYLQRAQRQRDSISKVCDTLAQVSVEAATFDFLRANELRAIPARIEVMIMASV